MNNIDSKQRNIKFKRMFNQEGGVGQKIVGIFGLVIGCVFAVQIERLFLKNWVTTSLAL